jgi:hypothetical protein
MADALTRVYRKGALDADGFLGAYVSEHIGDTDTVVRVDFCGPPARSSFNPPLQGDVGCSSSQHRRWSSRVSSSTGCSATMTVTEPGHRHA